MIIAITHGVNVHSQKSYDQIVEGIDKKQLCCPHCRHTGMTVHGYYSRDLKVGDGKTELVITRVKCPFCGKTHAILPDSIVPYSQIGMEDTIVIIVSTNAKERRSVMEQTPSIDESDVYRVLRNYKKHWKQRLLSYQIDIRGDSLIESCIRSFRRSFMQIPCTLCGSYSCHHTIQQDLPMHFT